MPVFVYLFYDAYLLTLNFLSVVCLTVVYTIFQRDSFLFLFFQPSLAFFTDVTAPHLSSLTALFTVYKLLVCNILLFEVPILLLISFVISMTSVFLKNNFFRLFFYLFCLVVPAYYVLYFVVVSLNETISSALLYAADAGYKPFYLVFDFSVESWITTFNTIVIVSLLLTTTAVCGVYCCFFLTFSQDFIFFVRILTICCLIFFAIIFLPYDMGVHALYMLCGVLFFETFFFLRSLVMSYFGRVA